MSSPALERLESLLHARKLTHTLGSALARQRPVVSTGIPVLDARLGGGWPCGEVSELLGRQSSGRTSVLLSTLAAASRRGGLVGLVDAFDRFDPWSAARAGLDLDRLLWVRGTPATSLPRRSAGGAEAGTIVNAIRALDLIVRAGGFALVALDVADAPPRAMRTVPFTTWLRIAHANEGRDTACVLVADAPIGRSARGRSLQLDTQRIWIGARAQRRRFAGFRPKAAGV